MPNMVSSKAMFSSLLCTGQSLDWGSNVRWHSLQGERDYYVESSSELFRYSLSGPPSQLFWEFMLLAPEI